MYKLYIDGIIEINDTEDANKNIIKRYIDKYFKTSMNYDTFNNVIIIKGYTEDMYLLYNLIKKISEILPDKTQVISVQGEVFSDKYDIEFNNQSILKQEYRTTKSKKTNIWRKDNEYR